MPNSISLREFIAGLDGLPRQGTLWTEGVTLELDGRGPKNAHLAFPVDPKNLAQCTYHRKIPLSLDERVYGDHLLLTFCGHQPDLVLTEHDSLDEMRSEILGDVGSFNCWIDAQFAFYKLKPLPFSIRYTYRLGHRKTFNIEAPEPVTDDWDWKTTSFESHAYRDVEFEWLFNNGG